jgi:hypothetical protein
VIAALVNVPGPQMLAPLEDLVVALRRLELVEVLREVVASVERDRPMSPQLIELEGREPDVRPLSRQLVLAGALATIGDPRGAELLERACATLPTSRVAHCHEVARCLAVAPTELATAGLRRLSRELATTTDSWGTNSHYCRSRLQVVDGLVLGACESWRGRLPRAA